LDPDGEFVFAIPFLTPEISSAAAGIYIGTYVDEVYDVATNFFGNTFGGSEDVDYVGYSGIPEYLDVYKDWAAEQDPSVFSHSFMTLL